MFTHLHLHTQFSLLDGACRLDRLVCRAKELGMTSLAITDHGNMYGAVDFYKECKGRESSRLSAVRFMLLRVQDLIRKRYLTRNTTISFCL